MKKLVYILALGILTASCNNGSQEKAAGAENGAALTSGESKGELPQITFENGVHDFGKIVEGEVVEYSFKFTNTGKGSLLIRNAAATCGCTIPEWPKEPIKPGESGYMKVVFNSKGKPEGFTEKEITIEANTDPVVVKGPKIQCTIVKKA
ncbi:DUF1573 domain-containing protein [Chitinophaga sedimenti]|uniref:DUF1573 domain-containing protein n=1 Tax=Chitinophaga sedimenti TaxID=2033606 RepID=UPI0020063D74|nr:DUF1573 domain-containing protein [Chitinophaga sedimenti]MCK7553840.1 DUF1573 domain-containing protein [Chitinophaga sedimenti]